MRPWLLKHNTAIHRRLCMHILCCGANSTSSVLLPSRAASNTCPLTQADQQLQSVAIAYSQTPQCLAAFRSTAKGHVDNAVMLCVLNRQTHPSCRSISTALPAPTPPRSLQLTDTSVSLLPIALPTDGVYLLLKALFPPVNTSPEAPAPAPAPAPALFPAEIESEGAVPTGSEGPKDCCSIVALWPGATPVLAMPPAMAPVGLG